MVEFLITLLLFFVLLFTIIDFSIAVYNKGAVVNAARSAARQGSLFWFDPIAYDPATPLQNVRLQERLISSAADAYLDLLLRPDEQDVSRVVTVNGETLEEGQVVIGASGAEVVVDLAYPYGGLTGVPGIAGVTLRAITGALAEPDL
jgi:hypothetical protein